MKTKRIDMRTHPAIKQRVEELAVNLATSRNTVIENAILAYCDSDVFIRCPQCGLPVADETLIAVSGFLEFKCRNGHIFTKEI